MATNMEPTKRIKLGFSLFESPPPTPSPLISYLKLVTTSKCKRTSGKKKQPTRTSQPKKRKSSIRPRARKRPAPTIKKDIVRAIKAAPIRPRGREPLGKWSDDPLGIPPPEICGEETRHPDARPDIQSPTAGAEKSRRRCWLGQYLPADPWARLGIAERLSLDEEQLYLQATAGEVDWSPLGSDDTLEDETKGGPLGEEVLLQASFLVGVLLNIGVAYDCDIMPYVWKTLGCEPDNGGRSRTWKDLCDTVMGDAGERFVRVDLYGRESKRFAHSLGLAEDVLVEEIEAEAQRRDSGTARFVGLNGSGGAVAKSPAMVDVSVAMEDGEDGRDWLICRPWGLGCSLEMPAA